MMKKWLLSMLLVLALVLPVFAQNPEVSSGPDDYMVMMGVIVPTWPTAAINSWVEGQYLYGGTFPFQYSAPGYYFEIPSAWSIKKNITLTLMKKIQYKNAEGVWKQATSGGFPMKVSLGETTYYPSPHWIWYGWACSFVPDQAGLHRVIFTAKKADGTVVWNNINMFWVGNE